MTTEYPPPTDEMVESQVTDEMVKAATLANFAYSAHPSDRAREIWSALDEGAKASYRRRTRAALEAALGARGRPNYEGDDE